MTHIDQGVIDAAMPYFEPRDHLARLLKAAGVKKHAREYVAEVLLDAGVIDLDELDRLAAGKEEPGEPSSDALAAEWLEKVAWWNDTRGFVTGVNEETHEATFVPDAGRVRVLPASWLTHESPAPIVDLSAE